MSTREDWLTRIGEERLRQDSLFGSEWDRRNGPNDWIALLGHYGAEVVTKKHLPPSRQEFEEALVKAAAVALAALENLDAMVEKKRLLDA